MNTISAANAINALLTDAVFRWIIFGLIRRYLLTFNRWA